MGYLSHQGVETTGVYELSVTPRGRFYRGVWVICHTNRPLLQECISYLSHEEADTAGVPVIIGWKSHRLNAAPEPNIMNDDQTKTNSIVYMAPVTISSIH